MNKIESIVYNLVRKNPALKQAIRNLYQNVFDLMPRRKEYLSGELDFRENYFFGFHDVSPLSSDEKKLLAMHNTFDFRMPKPSEAIEVGYFDFCNGQFGEWHKISESFAWNYHKGCRLQWLDDKKLIFNSAINGQLCSIITDVMTHETRVINYPIDAIYINGVKRLATSFSYERLERCMPGYGYPYKDNGFLEEPAPDSTGLYLINLDTEKRERLISLKEIAITVTGQVEQEYLHFVTHSEFSKDGNYISFLYRRIPRMGDYMKRRSVLCVYDLNDGKLIVLPTQESGSHYVWNGCNQIVASVNLNGKNCHALFSPENLNLAKMIDPDHLNSDGHQSFISDTEFITDTYPDKWRMAKLYRTNIETGESKQIASIYSPKKFQTKNFRCHIACDLHPRVIGNGKYVCFDSPRTGKRGLYVMKLN